MSLGLTQTTAPTLCRAAVTSAPRSLRARPPVPTHAAAALANMNPPGNEGIHERSIS